MKSFTTLKNLATNLSNNTSTSNDTLMGQLINDQHRYLLQKYYANEGSFSISTVGAQSLTTTAVMITGATTATLSSAWTYHSTVTTVTFSNSDVRQVKFTAGSTAISWVIGLTAAATTALAVGALQFYPLPPNYSKMKTLTITIGSLKWTPTEILTREQWDKLNVFPYYSDIPNNFFIYPGGDHGGQVGIYPIPSTTGNLITFNYKFRVPDLSIADIVDTATTSVSSGSTAVTSSGVTWAPTTNPQLESRWIRINEPKGDNLWYQIGSVLTTATLTLYQPYQGITVASGTSTIGQMPLLAEDFHDMLVYGALKTYFASIKPDPDAFKQYDTLYKEKLEMMEEYSGSNTINVNLGRRPTLVNPNLFPQSLG